MSIHKFESPEAPIPGLKSLPMERLPERDLWPGIAARIRLRRSRWPQPLFTAAACALLALSAMLSLRLAAPPKLEPQAAAQTGEHITDLRANRALIKANLRLTRNAEGELRKALRQTPGDEALRGLLHSTRERSRELQALLVADRE